MRGDFMKRSRPRRSGAPALEWLCDLSGQTARITSIGNRALLVENHCGIRAFSDDKIVLATRCGDVAVDGRDLCLNEVRRDALVIRGSIEEIHLPCAEAEGHEI